MANWRPMILAERPRTGGRPRAIMLSMNPANAKSRFLLLPELRDPSVSSKQPVLRRYSLARLPSERAEQRREDTPRA